MRSQCMRDSTNDGKTPHIRQPLQQRSPSAANSEGLAAIRLVPKTPPRLLGPKNEDDNYYYSKTPLPTHFSHILLPPKRNDLNSLSQSKFHNSNSGSSRITSPNGLSADQTQIRGARTLVKDGSHIQAIPSSTGSPRIKPSIRKRQLDIHADSKTFSLRFPDENRQGPERKTDRLEENIPSKPCPELNIPTTCATDLEHIFDDNRGEETRQGSNSHVTFETLCTPVKAANDFKTTLISDKANKTILKDSFTGSPCNYKFIGGLRKVPETPDQKEEANVESQSTSFQPTDKADLTLAHHHNLSNKHSFSSATSTSSEVTNYNIYSDVSSSISSPRSLYPETPNDSTSPNINHNISPESIKYYIHNHESKSNEVPQDSRVLFPVQKLESPKALIISPAKSGLREPIENYINKSLNFKEPLSVSPQASSKPNLKSQQVLCNVFSSNTVVQVAFNSFRLNQDFIGPSSWDGISKLYPPWSHMYEYPHQWSSQLSTVLSVSDENSERGSISWSESSQLSYSSRPRVPSIDLRTNIQDNTQIIPLRQSLDDTIGHPVASFSPRPRLNSGSSARMIAQPDEHGDGITDMHNMRIRPLRRRTSTFYSSTSSENGRSNTIRSNLSSNSNMLNLATIPTWARLYYGSGERRRLPSSRSTNGFDSDSRTNSLLNFSHGTELYKNESRPLRKRNQDTSQLDDLLLLNNSNPTPNLRSEIQRIGNIFHRSNLSTAWSPHLHPDRRIKRTCMRGPPTVFSMGGGILDRRNIQIVMFIIGFLVPFCKYTL